MTARMIVDAHHHVWDAGYSWLSKPGLEPLRRTFDVADLRAALATAGVTRTVLVEAGRGDAAEVGEFLALAAQTPEIVGVVGWASLADPEIAQVLSRHRNSEHGRWLVGIRDQIQNYDAAFLDDFEVRCGLREVAAAGLVFDLVVRVDQLASCVAAAAAVPQLRFVLDHLGKPSIAEDGFDEWRAAITPLAAQPNVYAKLSGLVTEAEWTTWKASDLRPYVETALELFGPSRLMYGSDWPVCTLAGSYQQVFDAIEELVPEADRAAIFGGTATRVYRLRVR